MESCSTNSKLHHSLFRHCITWACLKMWIDLYDVALEMGPLHKEKAPLLGSVNGDDPREYGPQGLTSTGRCCGGVVDDYRRRAPLCASDYTDAFTRKTLSALFFMFFATFASTVSLGELANKQTKGIIGVNEYLTQQSTCGMVRVGAVQTQKCTRCCIPKANVLVCDGVIVLLFDVSKRPLCRFDSVHIRNNQAMHVSHSCLFFRICNVMIS